jgi:hypothetical protein
MDNRLNEIRKKISFLRSEMLMLEDAIREQIRLDQDCSEASLRLMAMRQALSGLIRDWTGLGGGERLPTIQERLKQNLRPPSRPIPPALRKTLKRRLAARG